MSEMTVGGYDEAANAANRLSEENEKLRMAIKALIEFGDHLDYCRTKKQPNILPDACDCGRTDAVNEGWALVAPVVEKKEEER